MTPQILFVDQHHATLIVGPLGVVVWRGEASPSAVRRVLELGIATAAANPSGFGMIGVVELGAKAPDATSRQLSASINDELAAKGAVGFAAIIPQPGFAGAWIRAVVTSLNWLARNDYPFRAYESSEMACQWLLQSLLSSPAEYQEVARVLDAFRERYGIASESGSFVSLGPI
ncbi:MAG TPA: hypothetical protein VIV60_19005 [Polyangiaceae bacterium]